MIKSGMGRKLWERKVKSNTQKERQRASKKEEHNIWQDKKRDSLI